MRKPGDDPDSAMAAVARLVGDPQAEIHLMHRSNNVVARVGDVVAKVTNAREPGGLRERNLAMHGTEVGAPVLAPARASEVVDDLLITWWPYVRAVRDEADSGDLSRALAAFHTRMSTTEVALPSLAETARSTLDLLFDHRATSAMPNDARAAIEPVLVREADRPVDATDVVVHGEPHSGNYLVSDQGVILIDLEGVKVAPVEYDLAFLSAAAASHWPDHDPTLLAELRSFVSAQVATNCWRHVTARPGDEHARWHAVHHGSLLISARG